MPGFFKRTRRAAPVDAMAFGSTVLARQLASGSTVPPHCVGLVFELDGQGGMARRVAADTRVVLGASERACCYHPGPYSINLLPCPSAPELGLRVQFAVDTPDPRGGQQRFDLYLMSEAGAELRVAAFGAAIEAALQRELAQGNLQLPPCTTLDEWHAFRAGFNELLYTRFGVCVDDCLPVDLGEQIDYAAMLRARAALPAVPASQPAPATIVLAPVDDAHALRRLFLELPGLTRALRLVALPLEQALFRQHQQLLQRLDLVSLSVTTMPALELAAPGEPLGLAAQQRRTQHARQASIALDEAWALLARIKSAAPAQLASLFDEADRILANLELACAARRDTA